LPPVETLVRVNDPEGTVERSDLVEESSHHLGFDWVDPKMTRFTFVFRDSSSISFFVDKYNILKSDANDGILAIDYCHLANTICIARSPLEILFFFVYSCLFLGLHVAFPFDDFIMWVLWALNVAPSQLHHNTWVSFQTFQLICDMFHLSSTPSTFLHYYTSHLIDPVSWLSFINRSSNILFALYTTSYKNFKEKFFKLFVESEGKELFFDENDRS